MIHVGQLHKQHAGRPILRGLSLQVNRGEVLALVGPSGAGKSTLLRCINGLETFDAGEISVNGRTLLPGTYNTSDFRRLIQKVRLDIGMVFQSFCLFPHLSVLDNIMLAPCRVLGLSRVTAEEEARRLLAQVHLTGKEGQYPRSLSGGEQQRVAIARALAMKPQAMLFDEPTSSLDPELVGEVLAAIEELARGGLTMIIVTHHLRFARRCASRIALLDQGVVVEEAAPEEFFSSPKTQRAKTFLADS